MRSTAISVVFMALLGSAMAYPAPQLDRRARTKTVTKTVTSTKVVFEDITITPTPKSTPPPAPVSTSTSIVIVEPEPKPVPVPQPAPVPAPQPVAPAPSPSPSPEPVRKPIENVVEPEGEEEKPVVVVKPPVQTNNGGGSGFQAEILARHNAARAEYGNAPALSWDSTIAAFAQNRANTCVMVHDAQGYGENLAMGAGDGWDDESKTASKTVAMWVEEVSMYSFSNGGFSKDTGHFTQVVWKDTTKIGCAYKDCNNPSGVVGRMVVCNYDPPGNYAGEFQKNVAS